MHPLRKLAVTVAAACTVLLTGTAASAATATTWTVLPSPSGAGPLPMIAVSCPEASFCMAIGQANPLSTYSSWNGSSWSAPAAGFGDYSVVTSVSCTTPSFCLAAGYNILGQGYGVQASAWAWNGTSWQAGADSQPGKYSYLNAVKCLSPSDCEAVGNQAPRSSGTYHVLGEAWNGSTLAVQPVRGSVPGTLSAVACKSAGNCEAVGDNVAAGWNGSAWSAQKLPALSGDARLDGVSCYPAGCTAAGTLDVSGTGETLAEQWNGTRWALQSRAGSGDVKGAAGTWWDAVRCGSAAHCTVAGYSEASAGGEATLAEEWDGHTWSKDVTPGSGAQARLNALSCTPGTDVCTAAGFDNASASDVFALRN